MCDVMCCVLSLCDGCIGWVLLLWLRQQLYYHSLLRITTTHCVLSSMMTR